MPMTINSLGGYQVLGRALPSRQDLARAFALLAGLHKLLAIEG